jgi:hypothetical protein
MASPFSIRASRICSGSSPSGSSWSGVCCPFLSFSLRFDPEPPAVRLELVGGEDVKRFLQGQLAG